MPGLTLLVLANAFLLRLEAIKFACENLTKYEAAHIAAKIQQSFCFTDTCTCM